MVVPQTVRGARFLFKGKTIWLNFKGINYRANIWLNGKQIADSDEIAGAWRTYELNITNATEARS